MTAKLEKIHEMYKLLNEKERVNHDILSTFGRFGLSQTLRRLGLEKLQGVSALQLIISLCLFRFNGESVFGMYRKDFLTSSMRHPTHLLWYPFRTIA